MAAVGVSCTISASMIAGLGSAIRFSLHLAERRQLRVVRNFGIGIRCANKSSIHHGHRPNACNYGISELRAWSVILILLRVSCQFTFFESSHVSKARRRVSERNAIYASSA